MAKEVYGDDNISNHGGIFGMGEENVAYQKYFTGKSYLKMLTSKDNGIAVANVTFEPGCRNHWHIHAAKEGGGQLLLAIEGKGIYQEKGKDPVIMTPGTVVFVPSNVEHFHGAYPTSWFSHLAIEIPGKDSKTIWLKEVNEEEYLKATTTIKE